MRTIKILSGQWNFPILRALGLLPEMLPGYSIRDHVVEGSPNFVDNYKIQVDSNSTPFELVLAYDIKLGTTGYSNGEVSYYNEQNLPKGHTLTVTQRGIDSFPPNDYTTYEQLSPR